MINITVANFADGSRVTRTNAVYQYDYGQILKFSGLELPSVYEVHFSNQEILGTSKTAIGTEDGVVIPDEYLLSGEKVYAWIFLHVDNTDGETEYKIIIPVNKRAKPTDTEPTPVQQDVITQTIALLQDETGRASTSADRAEDAAVRAEEAAASIDEEMIEKAVSDYLDDHPITVTEQDPTVPSWAKQPNKPTYTAQEVGAVSTSGLPDAIDTALAQAKASGEFDGAPGEPGEDGYSPSASVSKSGNKSTITITDKSGTTTAQVLDGTPGAKGDPGQDGYTPQKGIDYFDGAKGDPGSPGEDGFSPSASVSKNGTVTTITVTDKSGTTTAQVNDGTNGQPGEDGYSPSASVSKSGNTATISITDKNGTTTAQISDGTPGSPGTDGDDGVTPEVTVTAITGGHNVAFSYGSGDSRNTDFDVMDGSAGGGLTEEIKLALLAFARGVAYVDSSAYDTLYDALTETRRLIHNWDFTQSAVDRVGGVEAVPGKGSDATALPTITSVGLSFTEASQYVSFEDIYARGRTYEIDISDFSMPSSDSQNIRFVMYGDTSTTGTGLLIWRRNNVLADYYGWAAYIGTSWPTGPYGSLTAKNAFVNSTVKIKVADDGTTSLYLNGSYIGDISLAAPDTTSNLYFGSAGSESQGARLYSARITAFRVYEEVTTS